MDFDHIGEMIGPVQNPLSFYWKKFYITCIETCQNGNYF
jgi:hypothetical protein